MRIENEPGPDGSAPSPEDMDEAEVRAGTVSTGHGPDQVEGDVVSDPALDDRLGSDWADEGGATTVGPATTAPGREAAADGDDPKRHTRIDREREES